MPNSRRLKMHVADVFRKDATRTVIVAPAVAVFSQWAQELLVRICLLQGQAAPGSVDAIELQSIWARALGAEMSFLADGECALAARQARTADRLIRSWWPDGQTPRLERGFWSAGKAVSARLASSELLTAEGWLKALAVRLGDAMPLPLALPEELLLDGFLELTSLEKRVFSALEQRGVMVENWNLPQPVSSQVRVCSFRSLEEELSAAAHWAKAQLKAGAKQIAVVINALETHVHLVRTIFDNVLCTERRVMLQDLAGCEFHLAHGEPLVAHPVINDAVLLLSLAVNGFGREREFPSISRWLLSPYWQGADTERVARARLELHLRKAGRYWCSPAEVARLAQAWVVEDQLTEMLTCSHGVEQIVNGALPGTDFAKQFYAILEAWGWPGPLAKGSDVTRHVTQFSLLLESLGGFSLDTAGAALRTLQQMCAESRLELRGGPLSPVQILSHEDAAGRRFDAAWIANVHDGNWPSHPLMNPFLPASAAEHIPRCTAAGELQYCELLTDELKALAEDVCFSWSQQTGDVANGISPLLVGLTGVDQAIGEANPSVTSALHGLAAPQALDLSGYRDHPWLVAVPDLQGFPLQKPQGAMPAQAIPGGAGMVNDQSNCPMMAYFRHRLKAGFEDMPAPFADAAYRGSLMHAAMQFLFSEQPGHLGVPSANRVAAAVDAAMTRQQARLRLLPVSYEAERLRLVNLLHQWLEFEAERSGFIVECLEQSMDGELHGHPISVRADRIDRLDDGGLIIIDYKSSKGSAAGWSHERLKQAQLPLYAVLMSRQGRDVVSGITLATVRGGECEFIGVSRDVSGKFDGIKSFDNRQMGFAQRFSDWDDMFRHWEQRVDALGAEIEQGLAANTLYDTDCLKWAGLDILLRRQEGEAWLLEHGGGTGASEGEYDEENGGTHDD